MADLFSDGQDALFTPDQGTVQQQVIQAATLHRLQHRYQYRLSRILWIGKLLLLAIPLTLQAVNLVKEWKRFRTLIQ